LTVDWAILGKYVVHKAFRRPDDIAIERSWQHDEPVIDE
jgi:hypothetical protein